MFVDFQYGGPPPGPMEPKRTAPALTKRQEKTILWILALNVVLLFLAPIAGVTVIEAAIALFHP